MSRIVSVWLRAWPIARLLSAQASGAPADLVARRHVSDMTGAGRSPSSRPGKGGRAHRLAQSRGAAGRPRGRRAALQCPLQGARPAIARRRSCRRCRRPAQAGAVVPALHADRGALGRGKRRRRPVPRRHGVRSISSAARRELLADLERRLRAFGLYPRTAIAGTAGASWAMARHGRRRRQDRGIGRGRRKLSRTLPLAALRLSASDAGASCAGSGFQRIGELIDQPRAPFAARFEPEYLRRLDQALGARPSRSSPSLRRPSIARRRCSSSRS